MRPLDVRRLGVVPYQDALALQRALVEERRAGSITDTLLLLQHPPVITQLTTLLLQRLRQRTAAPPQLQNRPRQRPPLGQGAPTRP